MSNLLDETLDKLEETVKKPEDIKYIGDGKEYFCSWKDFITLADFNYDESYGAPEVAQDLVILFNDNSWLERGEYDGSEWWDYTRRPEQVKRKEIKRLRIQDNQIGWQSLKSINEEGED